MNRSSRIFILSALFLSLGCNTFTEPEPYVGGADSGNLDDGGLDAAGSDMGDASVGEDAQLGDAGVDMADGGIDPLTPVATPGDECMVEPQHRGALGGPYVPTGNFNDDIALGGLELVGDRTGGLTYSDAATGIPYFITLDFGEVSLPTSEYEGEAVDARGVFDSTLENADTDQGSVTFGGPDEFGETALVVTGDNCSDEENFRSNGIWYIDPFRLNDGALAFRDCDSSPTTPHYFSLVNGGFNPFTGGQEAPLRIFAINEDGFLASALDSAATPAFHAREVLDRRAAWAKDTTGDRILTAQTTGELIVWNLAQPGFPPVPVPDPHSDDADTSIRPQSPNLVDIAFLTESRYLLARLKGGQVQIDAYSGTPTANNFEHEFVVDAIGVDGQVLAVALATFDGGFALFYLFDAGDDQFYWITQPYTVSGDEFVRSDCSEVHAFGRIEVHDVEGLTFTSAQGVFILWGVNFSSGGENRINVEGAFFGDL